MKLNLSVDDKVSSENVGRIAVFKVSVKCYSAKVKFQLMLVWMIHYASLNQL